VEFWGAEVVLGNVLVTMVEMVELVEIESGDNVGFWLVEEGGAVRGAGEEVGSLGSFFSFK